MRRGLSVLVVLLMVSSSHATLVVDFTASTNTVNSRAADVDSVTGDVWNFSDSIVLISSGGGSSDKVYGGMTTTWASGLAYAPAFRWLGTTVEGQIQVNAGVYDTSLTGIFLWNKADFLNGADAQTVSFSAGDSIEVNLTTLSSTTRDLRFVINQGGTYYVSDVNKTDIATGVFSIDPSAITWRTISTDGNYTIGATASTIVLDDIQGIGLYVDAARKANQTNIKFSDFQVNATVIPEPATIGMLGLGAMLALLLRRHLTRS